MNKKTVALVGFFIVAAVLGSTVLSPNRVKKIGETAHSTAKPIIMATATPAPLAAEQHVYNTNSWYSSVYTFPSQPLFNYPTAYRIFDKGIGVSLPQRKVTEKTIYGSYDEICVLNGSKPLKSSSVARYGDWNVDILVGDGTDSAELSLVQGSPISHLSGLAELHVSCVGGTISRSELGVLVVRGDAVLLFQGKGEVKIANQSENEFSILSPSEEYRVIAIPSKAPADIEFLATQSWNKVLDTKVSYSNAGNRFETKYEFVTESNEPVITTIWPHHGRVDGATLFENRVYPTVLGSMKLVSTRSFTTSVEKPDLAFQFSEVKDSKKRQQIINAIKVDADKYLKTPSPEGVYFKGTWIGALTTLVQLSDLYGMQVVHQQLLDRLEVELDTSLKEFSYDDKSHMLVAQKAEFGNEKGNDHHFHYGYYIRAAAVAGRYSPEKIASYSGVINEMIADISEESLSSERYPRLRSYSVYEGHSWADGVAGFADGNNQESTSESLQAWYAVWTWGEMIDSTSLRNRGAWLFSQELAGVRSYWFGINNPFPNGYSQPIASLVWGGKRDFSTWFSAQPMHVIGIQLLPITPASGYLRENTNGLLIEAYLRKLGGETGHEWSDLYTAYLSYFNPDQAAILANSVDGDGGLKLKSLLYQTVYSNLGKGDL